MLLLKHAGTPLSQAAMPALEQASPEQLLDWIHLLIDAGQVPAELAPVRAPGRFAGGLSGGGWRRPRDLQHVAIE
jgi:hypothetical protein